jgi:hypothetical protein
VLAGRTVVMVLNKPEESSARHCGLYEEHVSVCDMAQNPVDQLAVERSGIHAESELLDEGSEAVWEVIKRKRSTSPASDGA